MNNNMYISINPLTWIFGILSLTTLMYAVSTLFHIVALSDDAGKRALTNVESKELTNLVVKLSLSVILLTVFFISMLINYLEIVITIRDLGNLLALSGVIVVWVFSAKFARVHQEDENRRNLSKLHPYILNYRVRDPKVVVAKVNLVYAVILYGTFYLICMSIP